MEQESSTHDIYKIEHGDFPPQLLEIPEPPEKLFIQGAPLAKDALYLSVVGSRKHSPYGKAACEKILSELRGTGIVIVSGLALGIDALAHRAALAAGLRTIAFPGSGLHPSVLYPASNRILAEKIVAAGGTLVSEFEQLERAAQYTFPQRNRLMAGIARGVLIIEAEELSGTRITARLATEYNRDVFAIPGPIFSETSRGANALIQQGAVPVTCGGDILKHWGLEQSESDTGNGTGARRNFDECSDDEKRILELITEPIPKEELITLAGIEARHVNILLSSLEIKGIIKEYMGKIHIVL